jgi:hypothetical protein
MKLVCFEAYSGGALLCDLLNKQKSNSGTSGDLLNHYSNLLKVPKHENISLGFEYFFKNKIKKINQESHYWYGTHCLPNEVDVSSFEKVIVVTNHTFMSKVFRLMRIYFLVDNMHTINKLDPKNKYKDIDSKLEKIKFSNPHKPVINFEKSNIVQLEFEDLVLNTLTFNNLIKTLSVDYDYDHYNERIDVWRKINPFLYDLELVDKFKEVVKKYDQM